MSPEKGISVLPKILVSQTVQNSPRLKFDLLEERSEIIEEAGKMSSGDLDNLKFDVSLQ